MTIYDMEEADKLCETVAIMSRSGQALHLKDELGPDARLDDVFVHYTGGNAEEERGSFRDVSRMRRIARRLQ